MSKTYFIHDRRPAGGWEWIATVWATGPWEALVVVLGEGPQKGLRILRENKEVGRVDIEYRDDYGFRRLSACRSISWEGESR